MRRRVTVPVVVSLVLLAAAVVGGGSYAMSDRASGPAVAGTIELNGWQSSKREDDFLQSVVNDFERSHPRIKVTFNAFNNYQATMLAKFSARRPPDVFYVAAEDFADWVRQGVLEPLNRFATRSKFSSKPFYAGLLNSFKYRGRIYGYPKDWSSLGMEINTRLLGNQPTPTTWAQLRRVASRLNVPNGKPICLSADWARLMAFVLQAGGSGNFRDANSAPFRSAANFYIGLIKDGLAATPDNLGSGWCGEAFGKERAAIAFEGNWMFPVMRDFPNVRFRTAPLPRGKKPGNLAFTVAYSMARDSKNKPAAWELLKYLTGRTGMRKWTSLGLALPARKDVKPVAGRSAFVKYAKFTKGWGNQVKFRNVWENVANNELIAVIQGKQSVNEMLRKIQAAARQG